MPRLPEPGAPGARYRAAGRGRLVSPQDLPAALSSRFEVLRNDPDATAVLLADDGNAASARALTAATAELFESLATPRRLEIHGRDDDESIARLVLDGVLEVEHAGRFVSGPAAHPVWFDGVPAPATSRLAALSHAALRHGEVLGAGDRVLQRRLYQFNSRPVTPEWRRRLAGDAAVRGFLRVGARAPRGLTHAVEPAWHYWRRNDRYQPSERREPSLKLYISPGIEALPDALHLTVAQLRSVSGMLAVKAGRDEYGLMRPDGLVAYFSDWVALSNTAIQLSRLLAGTVAQGVPFTAEVAGDGLLSWASDPPAGSANLEWAGDGSWRAWITGRLASSLTLAASRPAQVRGWVFALDRLSLDGVDPVTWAPTSSVWAGEAA